MPPVECTQFGEQERNTFYEILRARRDMRHFLPDPVEPAVLARVLAAAHFAPSVGLMQPWRFLRITDGALRRRVQVLVEEERLRTATALGARGDAFLRLKVEGIGECPELIVAALAPDDGTLFGRRTLPEEMALCSAACAIQNMWLAARAENLGLGWVSFFDPKALAHVLAIPAGGKPIAILCLGHVECFYPRPMLEGEGWRRGRPLAEMVFHNTWGGSEASA